jgi:hypothetical protein
MKQNGRRNTSFSLYDMHRGVIDRLAKEAELTPSELLRELIEAVSDTHAKWEGCFLRFERPLFRQEKDGRFL